MKKMLERIEGEGIQCIGLGIKSDSVVHFYKEHLVCDGLDEFVRGGYEELIKLLRRSLAGKTGVRK